MKPATVYKRNFILWADHSSILSNGFLFYTTKVIYSKDLFYTDNEYEELTGKRLDVQSIVEQPEIYIVAQCHDSIAEKLSYSEIRREDILCMAEPIDIEGVRLKDSMRFFQGKKSLATITYFITLKFS